ncbi:MAG: hypothetical protein AAGE61_04165 [Pseudomonadota bacterium]
MRRTFGQRSVDDAPARQQKLEYAKRKLEAIDRRERELAETAKRLEHQARFLLQEKRKEAWNFDDNFESTEFLDACFEIFDETVTPKEETDRLIKERLKAFGVRKRSNLFVHLTLLKAQPGYMDEACLSWHSRFDPDNLSSPLFRFERVVETLVHDLCEMGFQFDADGVDYILDFFANGAVPYPGQLHNLLNSEGPKPSLTILKQIGRRCEKGLEVSDLSRALATRLFDRYCGIDYSERKSFLLGDTPLDDTAEALLSIAGLNRFITVFDRYRDNRRNRALYAYASDEKFVQGFDELKEIFREAEVLVANIQAWHLGSLKAPIWITSEDAFVEKFGVDNPSGDEALTFGWWRSPGPRSSYRENQNFNRFRDAGRRITRPHELDYVGDYLSGRSNPSPFVFSDTGIPDIAAFTFDGKDLDGSLLNHLVTIEGSKPAKPWLAKAQSHLERIGEDLVLSGFKRWVNHLPIHDLDSYGIDWALAAAAKSYLWEVQDYLTAVETGKLPSDPVLARRHHAMKMIAADNYKLSLGVRQKNKQDYRYEKRDAEIALESDITDINRQVLLGLIWTSSLFEDAAAVDMLEMIGREMFAKRDGKFRSKKCGNAVVGALGKIGSLKAVQALEAIARSVQDRSVEKLVDQAVAELAHQLGKDDRSSTLKVGNASLSDDEQGDYLAPVGDLETDAGLPR